MQRAVDYILKHGSWVTRKEDPPDGWLWNAPIPGAGDRS
jgi:hypothetical protein